MLHELSIDSKTVDVKLLQSKLKLPQSGVFGKVEAAAVRAFQAKNALVVDGIVGAKTWAALLIDSQCDRLIESTGDLQEYAVISIPLIWHECQEEGLSNAAIAYILATAEHESKLGFWMEELASGEDYEGRGDLGNTEPGDGVLFKGRGYVQLTGRKNYADWADRLEMPLLQHPELACNPLVAAAILVNGMVHGSFTGYSLKDSITDNISDFYNARRIINHLDRAQYIAAIADSYLQLID